MKFAAGDDTACAQEVKRVLQSMLEEGLRKRQHVFW